MNLKGLGTLEKLSLEILYTVYETWNIQLNKDVFLW